jgi:hypothetical protein
MEKDMALSGFGTRGNKIILSTTIRELKVLLKLLDSLE